MQTYQELLETYFFRSKGKLVVLKRGNEPGTYLRVMTGKQTGSECKAVAAKYGPVLTKLGVSARLYTPPPGEEANMMYLVGKRQMPGSVALLEFTENDIQMDVDEMDPENMVEILMKALNKRVYDAQQAGAVAVVVIFDYHGAEPFVLEEPEGEPESRRIFIPALMIKREDGDMLRQCLYEKGPLEDDILLCAFQRVDSLSEQIAIAQRMGAAGVVVQQHEDVQVHGYIYISYMYICICICIVVAGLNMNVNMNVNMNMANVYCTILYCSVLFCTVLYCTVSVLYCISTVLCFTVLSTNLCILYFMLLYFYSLKGD
jgi:hypothetical protein